MNKKIAKSIIALVCGGVFCSVGLFGCSNTTKEEVTVYMPDGAPAIALAKMMQEDKEDDGVTYRVVDAKVIQTKVTAKDMDKNADICVMPVTAASKLLGKGDQYKMVGGVTHGNVYLISKENTTYTVENLSDLLGKTIGVLQINSVPGLTFKAILNDNNVAWQELSEGVEKATDKVNLTPIDGATAVGTLEGVENYVLAEPAVSAQAAKGYGIVGDLQAMYGGEKGYPQAVMVAKTSLIEERAQWLSEFLADVAVNDWLASANGEEIVSAISAHVEDPGYATTLKAKLLKTEVVGRCGIRFEYASQMQERVNTYLQAVLVVNQNATVLPNEAFYWLGK